MILRTKKKLQKFKVKRSFLLYKKGIEDEERYREHNRKVSL